MKSLLSMLSCPHILICVAAFSISAQAQDATVNVRFVSFPKAANAEPVELLLSENKTMEVEIPTNSISKTYELPALSTWALGKSSTDEEGKFVFQTYGKTQSIGGKDQLILIIRKGVNDADGFELTTLNNSEEGFSGGKYILMNASNVDIAGTIGTGKFSLSPNNHTLIAPKPTKTEGTREYCFAKFHFRKDEEIQPFFSSTWRFNKEARSMVFFYHDPKTKQLRVHTIRSYTDK